MDGIAPIGDQSEIMRCHEESHLSFFDDAGDEVHHIGLGCDVEGGGGFVGDEEFRVSGETHGDVDPLTHAAAQFTRVGAQKGFRVGEVDGCEEFDEGVAGRRAFSVALGGFFELFFDSHDGIQRSDGVLENVGDFGIRGENRLVVEEDGAIEKSVVCGRKACDGESCHAFSAAALADEGCAFSGGERKREVAEDMDGALLGRKGEGEILDGKEHERRLDETDGVKEKDGGSEK